MEDLNKNVSDIEESVDTNNLYQPKRGFMQRVYDVITYPFHIFSSEEKVIGSIKLELATTKDGGVAIHINNCEKKEQPVKTIYLTESSDFNQEMKSVQSDIKLLIQNYLKNTNISHIVTDGENKVSSDNTILRHEERKMLQLLLKKVFLV
ncbi:Uncharacterized protein QTN25_006677 [Entamoeba marina]